jgi:hypothetical protein
VAIADLNADGRPDLAVANLNSNTVSVLLGNGNGTFGVKTDFGVGSAPVSVAIADFNADGRPDLAVANGGYGVGSTVSVLLGNGDGTFGAKTDFGTGIIPSSVAIADLNADGRSDLAVANNNSGTVSVLLGNGDGSFGSETEFGIGSGPLSVAIADINADGRPDLAVANSGSFPDYIGTVSVLINTGAGTLGVPPPPAIPLAFRLLTPRPNPSRGTSDIRFLLPSDRPVEIALFDVTGRRVWSWASGVNLWAGPHVVTWNGRDESGTLVRSGVYILKAWAGRDAGVRKLVLQL